jgi:CheY-like chemotaxis protein
LDTPILIVEDNEDDAFLIQRALERANVLNPVKVVRSGEEALAYLKGEGLFKDRTGYPLPGLVLLDLKMPGIDGFAVLDWVRQQASFRQMRVVVLTSSTDVRDVNRAFRSGADSFLIKPADFLRLAGFGEALSGSWLWMNTAPPAVVSTAVAAARPGAVLPGALVSAGN